MIPKIQRLITQHQQVPRHEHGETSSSDTTTTTTTATSDDTMSDDDDESAASFDAALASDDAVGIVRWLLLLFRCSC
jgi:microcystin-dependent protein